MKTSSPTGYAETTVDTGGRCPLCAGAIKATAKVAYGVELSTRIGHKGEPIIAVTAKDVRVIHSALIPHKCVLVEDGAQ